MALWLAVTSKKASLTLGERAAIRALIHPHKDTPMNDIQSMTCRRLTLGTWAKLAFISNTVAFMVLGLIVGLASLLGAGHVGMGGQAVTGWLALPTALIATFVMGCVYAVIATLFGFVGLWLYAKFSDIRLDVLASDRSPRS